MERELSYLISEVEYDIQKYYETNYDDDSSSDFDFELVDHELIRKCISLLPKYKGKIQQRILYLAVISFYYLVVVSEYYVRINPRNIIDDRDYDEYHKMFMKLTCSNEEWASKIRRLVYRF